MTYEEWSSMESWGRALTKARKTKPQITNGPRKGTWMVEGSQGEYTVWSGPLGDMKCNCQAGMTGKCCYHVAAVTIRGTTPTKETAWQSA